jgi:hypothetical protein
MSLVQAPTNFEFIAICIWTFFPPLSTTCLMSDCNVSFDTKLLIVMSISVPSATLGRDLWGHSLLQNLRRRADRIKVAECHGGVRDEQSDRSAVWSTDGRLCHSCVGTTRSNRRSHGGHANGELVIERGFLRVVLRSDRSIGLCLPHRTDCRGCGRLQGENAAAVAPIEWHTRSSRQRLVLARALCTSWAESDLPAPAFRRPDKSLPL